MTMELRSLGHQSWLLVSGKASILVDPVLFGTFGASDLMYGAVNGPLPWNDWQRHVDAVILTCHHTDHLDLPSLAYLASMEHPPIVCLHNWQPNVVRRVVESAGLRTRVARVGEPIEVGDFSIRFLRRYGGEHLWERASASLCVQHPEGNIYLQAEGHPSTIADAPDKIAAAILTNNSQLVGGRRAGFFRNTRKPSDPRSALVSYYSSLVELSALENAVPAIIFTGTDFVFHAQGVPEPVKFDSVHSEEVQKALQALSNGVDVFLTQAGKSWHLRDGQVKSAPPSSRVMHCEAALLPNLDQSGESTEVKALLQRLQVPLMLAPLGRMLVNCHRYRGRPLGPQRLLLRLVDCDGTRSFAFNVNTSSFESCENELDDGVFPFYLRAPSQYFEALLNDKIGVWEFAHHPEVQQEYVGSATDSPLSFLASYFCPTVNPGHFERLHLGQLVRLRTQGLLNSL